MLTNSRKRVRKIKIEIPKKQLMEDLERYRALCLEMGALDAKIISTDEVVIDERVLMKCIYPKCENYGTSANCPPYAVTPQQMQRIVSSYSYAIFFTLQAPSESCAGPDLQRSDESWKKVRRLRFEITSRVECEAFYNGYYFAVGFGGGSCKSFFCQGKDCAVLKNKSCRAILRARSSMEAVGMDVYRMATKVGWDIYPIGKGISPKDVPFGRALGLILIH